MQILIIDKKACYSLYLSLLVRSSIRHISPSHSVNVNHERGNNFQETFRIAANDNQPSIPFSFLLFFSVLLCCCFFCLFVCLLFFFEKVQERTISRPQNTLKRIVFLLKKANSKPLILLWILNLFYSLIIIEKLETTYSLNYQSL